MGRPSALFSVPAMAVAGSLLCGIAPLVTAPARAAEPRDVEALIGQGMDLRRQGKDERALPFFQKAYGIEQMPRTAGQLGLAEMAVGYWLSSEGHLAEALESPGHPWIAKNRETLSAALEQVRKRIGEVVVMGEPPGARVSINGQDVGPLPLSAPVRVGEGRVQVEVTAPAYQPLRKTFHLTGGQKEQVAVALQRGLVATPTPAVAAPAVSPVPSSPPPAGASTTPAFAPVQATTVEGQAPLAASESGGSSRTIAYVAAALAAASLTFGVIETVQWKKKETEFENFVGTPNNGGSPRCGEDDEMRGPAGCEQIYNDGRSAWKLALVGYGVGALLAAGSIYFLVSSSGANAPGPPAVAGAGIDCRPEFMPHAKTAGVKCQVRF